MPFCRKVFLDTQVFKTNNFNFDSKPLKLLMDRATDDRVSVYITDIVEREVHARIRREVEESRSWYNSLREDARILLSAKGTPFHGLPKSLDVDAAADAISHAFDIFLLQADVTIIKCSNVRVEGILERYFEQKPPFNAGEKRKEFPDAISIEALADYFKNDEAFVISGDRDISQACHGRKCLHPLATLDEYLNLELADHEDVGWIGDALKEKANEIQEAISKAFSDGYFYLDDQEGEVAEVTVTNVSIEDISLLDVTETEGEATVGCRLDFEADISYDDPNSVIYSEGDRFSFGTIEEHVDRDERDSFSVTFEVDRVAKEISNISCTDTKSRSFSAVEYQDYK